MSDKQQNHNHVFAAFRDRTDAERAFDALVAAGYRDRDIHVMMTEDARHKYYPDNDEQSDKQHPVGSHATEGLAVGAATGSVVGAAGAAIAAAITAPGATIVIPGGFLIAGPIAAAMVGAGAGGVAGGLLGAMVGYGIPESNAGAYEAVLTEGGIILGVEPLSKDHVDDIEELFEHHNGENIWHG